jgi:hypothetical protein
LRPGSIEGLGRDLGFSAWLEEGFTVDPLAGVDSAGAEVSGLGVAAESGAALVDATSLLGGVSAVLLEQPAAEAQTSRPVTNKA